MNNHDDKIEQLQIQVTKLEVSEKYCRMFSALTICGFFIATSALACSFVDAIMIDRKFKELKIQMEPTRQDK